VVRLSYHWLQSALRISTPLFAAGSTKFGRGLVGRAVAHEELVSWGVSHRDDDRPVAWFHAPSAGEGHLAHAVIDEVRTAIPGVQIVYTFFSPSAVESSRSIEADVAAFLPWDLPGPMKKTLEALRPDVLVFTKTEVWPGLVAEACRRGVPVALIGASVPDGAGRLRGPARRFLRPTWKSLDFAGAATDRDRERLVELGVPANAAFTTGDPSVDSAATRFDRVQALRPWQETVHPGDFPTVVAGSTWPSDEDVLFPAITTLREQHSGLRVVVAPHEPSDSRVAGLLGRFTSLGWSAATLTEVGAGGGQPDAMAIVVDGVGDLALLYGVADVSFVGGGFRSAGVHSVLEPAAASAPVLFGPGYVRSPAAEGLLDAGGAKIARSSEDVARTVGGWLREPSLGKDVGRLARDYIERHVGAAKRSAERIANLMKTPDR